MLKTVFKLLKALNSETDPWQMALALSLGMVAGLTPFWSLHNLLVLFLVFILRTNLSSFIVSLLVFSGIGYLLDPLFHPIGLSLLEADALRPLWTALYNSTTGRLSHFNNSIVMGSLVSSLVLSVALFFLSRYLIVKYREHIMQWVRRSRLMQAIKATRLYRLYQRYESLKG